MIQRQCLKYGIVCMFMVYINSNEIFALPSVSYVSNKGVKRSMTDDVSSFLHTIVKRNTHKLLRLKRGLADHGHDNIGTRAFTATGEGIKGRMFSELKPIEYVEPPMMSIEKMLASIQMVMAWFKWLASFE